MRTSLIQQAIEGTIQGKHTFPEHLVRLQQVQIDSYTSDLQKKEVTYYEQGKKVFSYRLPLTFTVEFLWKPQEIEKALRAVQKKEITYVQFLEWIAKAGVTSYSVDIGGYQTTYYGKEKETYTEPFPLFLSDLLRGGSESA